MNNHSVARLAVTCVYVFVKVLSCNQPIVFVLYNTFKMLSELNPLNQSSASLRGGCVMMV